MKSKFAGNDVTLLGKQLAVGDKLEDFIVVKNDLSQLALKDTKGVRVFLTVPSLDTPVCSMEVAKFINYFKKLPDKVCYVVSMDLPFAQERWCQNNASDNVITTSDYLFRDFGKISGTYIKEFGLLARAVFVVNEKNEVIYSYYCPDVVEEPKYDEVIDIIK